MFPVISRWGGEGEKIYIFFPTRTDEPLPLLCQNVDEDDGGQETRLGGFSDYDDFVVKAYKVVQVEDEEEKADGGGGGEKYWGGVDILSKGLSTELPLWLVVMATTVRKTWTYLLFLQAAIGGGRGSADADCACVREIKIS